VHTSCKGFIHHLILSCRKCKGGTSRETKEGRVKKREKRREIERKEDLHRIVVELLRT
jgi:hypothetical protein